MVDSETIDSGINRPLKVTLERDGVKANAVFRTVAVEERNKQGPGGKFYRAFRDNYGFECAAYELALRARDQPRAAGGPARARRQGRVAPGLGRERDDRSQAPGAGRGPARRPALGARDQAEKLVFDALINNHDRNAGNELIDGDWNVWWIDHTRAFQTEHGDQRIEELRRITPELWSALRTVERARVRTVLQPFLRPNELDALFERWDRIVLRFRTLIAEHGAENVIIGF